jgi:hypothetical protein
MKKKRIIKSFKEWLLARDSSTRIAPPFLISFLEKENKK